jgi:hypothetical protein
MDLNTEAQLKNCRAFRPANCQPENPARQIHRRNMPGRNDDARNLAVPGACAKYVQASFRNGYLRGSGFHNCWRTIECACLDCAGKFIHSAQICFDHNVKAK